MPVTTPDEYAPIYNDRDHFKSVLYGLFIPAIEKANMQAIKPIAGGAELIHARIIKNLETSDLVLCDTSILNPNVFFEFGVRTSLNKPICIVKDDKTKRIPFDLTIINHHTYKSLPTWDLDEEINSLSEHIEKSFETSPNSNELWKYLSFTHTAQAPKEGEVDRIDMLVHQFESMKNIVLGSILRTNIVEYLEDGTSIQEAMFQNLVDVISKKAKDEGIGVYIRMISGDEAKLSINESEIEDPRLMNFLNRINKEGKGLYKALTTPNRDAIIIRLRRNY